MKIDDELSSLSALDKENLVLLLNRLKNITIFQTEIQQVKRMIVLIEGTGFELHKSEAESK